MEVYKLEKTAHSPDVILDPEQKLIRFEGNLVVADAVTYFKPIIGWVNAYFAEGNKALRIELRLDYFNTSASKMINLFLAELKKGEKDGVNIQIDWHYKAVDEDMAEMAEEAAEIADLDVNFIIHED